MPYDLFISYSCRDNEQGRITQLVERIKQDFAPFAKRELVPFFDAAEIRGMQDWRQRILQGLRESKLLLACLSPAYLKSDYCEWEFVEYLKYEIGHLHGFNGVAPIYFVVVPGWDDRDFDKRCAGWVAELRHRQNFDLRPWHDQGEAALREAAVRERMGKLNHQIAETILRGERAEKKSRQRGRAQSALYRPPGQPADAARQLRQARTYRRGHRRQRHRGAWQDCARH